METLAAPADGRSMRGQRARAAVLTACRELMCAGDFRPPVVAIADRADCSVRTVFQHFKTAEAVHLEAIDDQPTRELMVAHVLGVASTNAVETIAIARAIVLGRAT